MAEYIGIVAAPTKMVRLLARAFYKKKKRKATRIGDTKREGLVRGKWQLAGASGAGDATRCVLRDKT